MEKNHNLPAGLKNLGLNSTNPNLNDSQFHKIYIDKFSDIGIARVDHNRMARQIVPEVIYAPGKSFDDCKKILEELLQVSIGPVMITKATQAQITACQTVKTPDKVVEISSDNNLAYWLPLDANDYGVSIVTAGTADIPVAKECETVLNAFGIFPKVFYDCGVAGIDRVLAIREELVESKAVVVIAGMEGALASVVAGMVAGSVIGVPTSVGYGASLDGVTALLSMLASCSPGVSVVGIDNGFGAACAILRQISSENIIKSSVIEGQ